MFSDRSISSDIEANDTYVEETSTRSPSPYPGDAKDMIGQVKAMTDEQVQVLLHKLKLSDEEDDNEHINVQGKVYQEEEEPNSQHSGEQTKKTQRTQTKKPAKGNTKDSKHNEDDGSKLQNKTNKPKVNVKGKKNNSKSTIVDAPLEENPSKLENKKKGVVSDTLEQNENLNKKSKSDCSSEGKEKTKSNSKNDNVEIDHSKEKQTKQSKKVINHTKELESNNLETKEIHGEGRSMRPRRGKEVLKEINEPVKNLDSETVMVQNKRNGKKHESEGKNPEENAKSTAGKKNKAGKKEVHEVKKTEGKPVSIVSGEGNTAVKVDKTEKKVPLETKEAQGETIKEDVKTNLPQKNSKKGISEAVKNVIEEEIITNVKNTKAKKKTPNAKATEIEEDSQSGQVNTEKTKLKSKADLGKNKKLAENKENKINEETVPKKRAARKK